MLTARNAILALIVFVCVEMTSPAQRLPTEVPHRRSTQLADGFGMNIALPREPRMSWISHSWTPIFDSGVKWVRIGQYENSSEKTSWDWVEQTAGRYSVLPEVDEAIRSLRENGVQIEIQLQYSNPLYQGDPANRPVRVKLPPPGIGQNDEPVNPIFLPPKTEEQTEAFLKYVRFMVDRYKLSVKHWELWNEPDIGYWQPNTRNNRELVEKARWYGDVLSRFADAVHGADPQAKVIFGGLAEPNLIFARTALAKCASKIDVFAYHTYPGFGSNHMPEEADTKLQAAFFREQILRFPGVRNTLEFWVNEWNVSPKWENSDESVQARYLPRFYLYCHVQHVRGFVWTFVPGTDGNEGDSFGVIHGETSGPDAFKPRPAYRAFEVTSALFGQTEPDPAAEFTIRKLPDKYSHGELKSYAFQDTVSGKRIYAFWLAVLCDPADQFVPQQAELTVHDSGIRTPILIDVRSASVTALKWKDRENHVVEIPVKDSVMAVSDVTYLDWPELPAAPGELRAKVIDGRAHLAWKNYSEGTRTEVERSDNYGEWRRVAQLPAGSAVFSEPVPVARHITYRVRAVRSEDTSAWSNPAWIEMTD
jgi:hypothetical protein